MDRKYKYWLGIVLVLGLCCCTKQTNVSVPVALTDLTPVVVPAEIDSFIEIKSYLAIGPFGFNPLLTDPVRSFARNDLKKYGIKEGTMDEACIEKLQKRGVSVFPIYAQSPQIKLFGHTANKPDSKSHFYMIARIHSATNKEATLIMDGSYSYAAWLNGDKLLEVRGKHNVNKAGDRFVNVTLREGENMLFFKVNRGTNKRSWDLICAIASRSEGERIYRVNYASDFVVNPIVGNVLEVYAGPYASGRVDVLDGANRVVASGTFDQQNTNGKPFAVSGLGRLADGFYRTVLTVGKENIEQMVYKGNYAGFVKKMRAAVAGIPTKGLHVADMAAAMHRVGYLNEKQCDTGSESEIRFLNRNRVFWGYSLFCGISNPAVYYGGGTTSDERTTSAERVYALTQLMTYGGDGGITSAERGVFIFHCHPQLQHSIPLVIIVPSALEGDSMIEDWYTSNLDQIETDNALADRYGFAVAWIYAGGKNYLATKTEKEITAVLERLQSEYAIDKQRIFIMGDCEGGRRALVQLAATPGRYAGCVAASPITLSGGSDGVPINLLSQMGDVPILLRHGTDDDVSPVENSRRFYAEAQQLNMPVAYVEVAGSHVNVAKDGHRYVFEFFMGTETK